MTVLGVLQFQTWPRCTTTSRSFNTDDGIRRAAIISVSYNGRYHYQVSIPMTVLGGLQSEKAAADKAEEEAFQYR